MKEKCASGNLKIIIIADFFCRQPRMTQVNVYANALLAVDNDRKGSHITPATILLY